MCPEYFTYYFPNHIDLFLSRCKGNCLEITNGLVRVLFFSRIKQDSLNQKHVSSTCITARNYYSIYEVYQPTHGRLSMIYSIYFGKSYPSFSMFILDVVLCMLIYRRFVVLCVLFLPRDPAKYFFTSGKASKLRLQTCISAKQIRMENMKGGKCVRLSDRW